MMGVHRFDYPTAAAPTASITFPRGARLVGDTPGVSVPQTISRGKDGRPRVRNYGAVRRSYPLTVIVAMSSEAETDVEDLVTWFGSVAVGAANAFEWTDEDGVVRTARITSEGLQFPKFGWDSQSCSMVLEVE